MILNTINTLYHSYLVFWIICFVIILMCFTIIYPIILKSKIQTHDSLLLFTYIQIRDVDLYSNHYKNLFKKISDTDLDKTNDLMNQVEHQIREETLDYHIQKNKQDNRSGRKRNFKLIKVNKVVFFFQTLFFFLLFIMFNFFKDYNMIVFISSVYQLKDMHI